MNIRPVVKEDIPEIMRIIAKVVPLMRAGGNLQWDSTYPNPQAFENDIHLQQLWVAELDNKIAGVAAITEEQYPEYADAGLDVTEPAIVVHRLATDPDVRGTGVAKALMQKAEELSVERGYNLLRIDTNSKNISAGRLFESMGYRFCGEIGLKFRPGMRFNCYEKRVG